MLFVDTGFLIALANERDELHGRAGAWALATMEQRLHPLLLTEYVLTETVNNLSSRIHRARAIEIIDAVQSEPEYEYVPASPTLFASGLALYRQRTDKNWSLTDCISFSIMTERGVSHALAFDQHFKQAGFEPLLRHDP